MTAVSLHSHIFFPADHADGERIFKGNPRLVEKWVFFWKASTEGKEKKKKKAKNVKNWVSSYSSELDAGWYLQTHGGDLGPRWAHEHKSAPRQDQEEDYTEWTMQKNPISRLDI